MNCQEVQERLSEYLDQSLDGASARSIEGHLSACGLCQAEADVLLRCMENVAALAPVEPPLGFAQRVMSHIGEIEAQRSFWERLWLPLRIKVPIHATALVLIAILAVYVFEKEPSRRNLPTTAEQATPAPEKAERSELSPPETKQPPPSSRTPNITAPSPAKEKSTARQALSSRQDQQPGSTQPEPTAPGQLADNPATQAVQAPSLFGERREGGGQLLFPVDPRRRAQGVISGMPVTNPLASRIGRSPFARPPEAEGDFLNPAAPSLLPLADYEFVVRRRLSAEQEQALRENASAEQKQSAPAAVEPQQTPPRSAERLMAMIPDSAKPQTVWVTLASSQFEQFKRELASVGTIEAQSATSARDLEFAFKTDGDILIKLTVLPAPEPNRVVPGASSNR